MSLNVKAVVAGFNQEKALVGTFFVITNLRMELFEALVHLLFVCHRVTVNPGAIRTCAGAGRVKSPQLLLFTKLDVDYFCTPRPLPRAAASPHVRGSRTFLAFSSRAAEAS